MAYYNSFKNSNGDNDGGASLTGIASFLSNTLGSLFASPKYLRTEWQGWDAQDGSDAKGNSVVWHIKNKKPDEANDTREQENKIINILNYINNVGIEESFRRFKALYALPPSRGAELLRGSDFVARFTPYGYGDVGKQLGAAWDYYFQYGTLPTAASNINTSVGGGVGTQTGGSPLLNVQLGLPIGGNTSGGFLPQSPNDPRNPRNVAPKTPSKNKWIVPVAISVGVIGLGFGIMYLINRKK